MYVLEVAMQLEKNGEELYRELARKSSDEGLTTILNWLADEEMKHYQLFQKTQKGLDTTFKESDILKDAKDIFAKIKDTQASFNFDTSEIILYKEALSVEQKSIEFYTERAALTALQNQKSLLLKIVNEEKKHYLLINNIIKFISSPETWLENAEFNHLDDEY